MKRRRLQIKKRYPSQVAEIETSEALSLANQQKAPKYRFFVLPIVYLASTVLLYFLLWDVIVGNSFEPFNFSLFVVINAFPFAAFVFLMISPFKIKMRPALFVAVQSIILVALPCIALALVNVPALFSV